MATPTRVWLCDYDLPKNPPGRRVQFYRVKKRLIKDARSQNSEIQLLLSSMSVFLTNSESLARDVSQIAQDFSARSTHVYQLDWSVSPPAAGSGSVASTNDFADISE